MISHPWPFDESALVPEFDFEDTCRDGGGLACISLMFVDGNWTCRG